MNAVANSGFQVKSVWWGKIVFFEKICSFFGHVFLAQTIGTFIPWLFSWPNLNFTANLQLYLHLRPAAAANVRSDGKDETRSRRFLFLPPTIWDPTWHDLNWSALVRGEWHGSMWHHSHSQENPINSAPLPADICLLIISFGREQLPKGSVVTEQLTPDPWPPADWLRKRNHFLERKVKGSTDTNSMKNTSDASEAVIVSSDRTCCKKWGRRVLITVKLSLKKKGTETVSLTAQRQSTPHMREPSSK